MRFDAKSYSQLGISSGTLRAAKASTRAEKALGLSVAKHLASGRHVTSLATTAGQVGLDSARQHERGIDRFAKQLQWGPQPRMSWLGQLAGTKFKPFFPAGTVSSFDKTGGAGGLFWAKDIQRHRERASWFGGLGRKSALASFYVGEERLPSYLRPLTGSMGKAMQEALGLAPSAEERNRRFINQAVGVSSALSLLERNDRMLSRAFQAVATVEVPPPAVVVPPLDVEATDDSILIGLEIEVENALWQVCPRAARRFVGAKEAMARGDLESLSHGITSCRRTLRALADFLFPPQSEKGVGYDGRLYSLNDSAWLNRIAEFLKLGPASSSRSLDAADFNDLFCLMIRLSDAMATGVHEDLPYRQARNLYGRLLFFIDRLLTRYDDQ